MTVGGEYESPEKEAIRERLWDSAIAEVLRASDVKADSLTFLDLPGAKCIYLRHIIEKFGVRRDNIVAVEREEEPFLAIHHFLAGRGIVHLGCIEDLCESGALEQEFPIDIVNLDFCGQGFVFPDLQTRSNDKSEYQRRWDCVKQIIEFNRDKKKNSWVLLLTLNCNRNNPAGKKYLLSQLQELNDLTGIKKDGARWKDDRLIQEVVPKIIAEEALHRNYIPSTKGFDSYRYAQQGHSYRMVAWKFTFHLDSMTSLGSATSRHKKRLDEFCTAYFAGDGKELSV